MTENDVRHQYDLICFAAEDLAKRAKKAKVKRTFRILFWVSLLVEIILFVSPASGNVARNIVTFTFVVLIISFIGVVSVRLSSPLVLEATVDSFYKYVSKYVPDTSAISDEEKLLVGNGLPPADVPKIKSDAEAQAYIRECRKREECMIKYIRYLSEK